MDANERKQLREELLKEAYEHHFSKNGEPQRFSREKLRSDLEKKLAIEYLVDKGYLKEENQGLDNLLLKITSYGIDHVENQ